MAAAPTPAALTNRTRRRHLPITAASRPHRRPATPMRGADGAEPADARMERVAGAPTTLPTMTPDALVAAVAPLAGEVGGAFYFMPATLARGKELGLDGLRFYVIGRGGVLGDVEAPVVVSAFGYFNPSMIHKLWTTAAQRVAPREAARAYLECARRVGRERLSELDGLDELCDAAERVIAAVDPAGLALFAGVRAEPLPDDPPARAMQLAVVLRELRGSTHLLAVVASGLSPRVAHHIRRPEMDEAFGWKEAPEVTQTERDQLAEADALTYRLLVPAFGAVDDEQAEALV